MVDVGAVAVPVFAWASANVPLLIGAGGVVAIAFWGRVAVADALNYAYSNTRVKGMKSKLLDKKDYETALYTAGVADLAVFLQERHYPEIAEQAVKYADMDLLEAGLAKNMFNTIDRIKEYSTKRTNQLLNLLLAHWDVWSLKVIIRGIQVGESVDGRIKLLVAVGELTEKKLIELAGCESLEELGEKLEGTPYQEIVQENIESPEKLEDILDKYYFSSVLKKLEGKRDRDSSIIRGLIRQEIDTKNIVMRFRTETNPRLLESWFIEGGNLDVPLFRKELPALVAALAKTKYAAAVQVGYQKFLELKSLLVLERGLEKIYETEAQRLLHTFPLSIGPIVGYLASKENEVKTLRAIGRGKHARLPLVTLQSLVNING